MQDKPKTAKYYRVMFVLFVAASGLLLALFIREYSKHDELPIGRMPLMIVSLAFLIYYGKKLMTHHNSHRR